MYETEKYAQKGLPVLKLLYIRSPPFQTSSPATVPSVSVRDLPAESAAEPGGVYAPQIAVPASLHVFVVRTFTHTEPAPHDDVT
ncbi:MAG TPA: hypothetical protein PK020_09250 [Ilumatobacteraceae bacterium]|nr:hypothetical protein [Ilumatobacteraceae bacterium]